MARNLFSNSSNNSLFSYYFKKNSNYDDSYSDNSDSEELNNILNKKDKYDKWKYLKIFIIFTFAILLACLTIAFAPKISAKINIFS